MTHATNKDAGGTDPILAIAAMEERLKAVEEYLGIVIGSANFTLPKASPEIALAVQEIQKAHAGQTESPLKQSDLPIRSSATIPAPFRSEEFGISQELHICPDPTGEGSAWQGEVARSVPIGWTSGQGPISRNFPHRDEDVIYQSIIPDPSIPWGEGYEAILPEEAREGDEGKRPSGLRWWEYSGISVTNKNELVWRRRIAPAICPDPTGKGSAYQGEPTRVFVPVVSSEWIAGFPPKPYSGEWFFAKLDTKEIVGLKALPDGHSYDFTTADATYFKKERISGWMQSPDSEFIAFGHDISAYQPEPAPGSDAEHPPIGYKLAKVGDVYEKGYLIYFIGVWTSGGEQNTGLYILPHGIPIANPIPPAEIDRDTRDTEIAELRATVERLTAENAELRERVDQEVAINYRLRSSRDKFAEKNAEARKALQ